jgi:hypothetical protein
MTKFLAQSLAAIGDQELGDAPLIVECDLKKDCWHAAGHPERPERICASPYAWIVPADRFAKFCSQALRDVPYGGVRADIYTILHFGKPCVGRFADPALTIHEIARQIREHGQLYQIEPEYPHVGEAGDGYFYWLPGLVWPVFSFKLLPLEPSPSKQSIECVGRSSYEVTRKVLRLAKVNTATSTKLRPPPCPWRLIA